MAMETSLSRLVARVMAVGLPRATSPAKVGPERTPQSSSGKMSWTTVAGGRKVLASKPLQRVMKALTAWLSGRFSLIEEQSERRAREGQARRATSVFLRARGRSLVIWMEFGRGKLGR